MKGNWRYYLILSVLVLLLAVELFLPKPVSWMRTLSSDDKIPYGTYLLKQSLRDEGVVIPGMTRDSFYELGDSLRTDLLSISLTMANGRDDMITLIEHVQKGYNVVIAANQFGGEWDSIGVLTTDLIQQALVEAANPITPDSSVISMDNKDVVFMAQDNAWVFDQDSTWQVLARHESGDAVIISRIFGEGRLMLASNPYIFCNYYLLRETALADALLANLDPTFTWTELYSRGRGEPQTPLRYILSQPSLAWAYYLTIFTLLVFVIFEAKRKQRAIPVIIPLKNDSLDFAKTVGNLYYEQKDHKKVAEKMIAYLLEHIRNTYFLSTSNLDNEFFRLLSHKSGKPLINIEGLFTLISIIQNKDQIDEVALLDLNTKIEAFKNGREQVRATG